MCSVVIRSIAALTAVALMSIGCSGDAVGTAGGASEPSGNQSSQTELLQFHACDITTASGVLAGAAECAEMTVPARRGVAIGRSIKLDVKRFRRETKARGQLWLIAGGPGSAASDFEADADFYLGLGQGLELYFMDHRGTGRSTRLGCAAEEDPNGPAGEAVRGDEWASCAKSLVGEWGEDLAGFNPTEAASDLGEAIERTRHDDQPVFLYAVSYGTYLVERYLQLRPQQPNGVILDSICSPGKCDLLLEYDRQFDATARSLFALCAADSICSRELGQDPVSHVLALSEALNKGHCPEIGWSATTLRQVLGTMVMTAQLRDYMPAVVKRVERCAADDIAVLAHFRQFLSGIDTESSSFSYGLYANIALSELSPQPLPKAQEVKASVEGLIASIDAGPKLADAIGALPLYPRDSYFGKLGHTDVPMLMLNGTLDPQTPLAVAQPSGDFYQGAHQRFVSIPYSPHTTLTQSLLDGAGRTCGAELARQFLDEPKAELDLTCLSQIQAPNFSGFPDLTEFIFGTSSTWGG